MSHSGQQISLASCSVPPSQMGVLKFLLNCQNWQFLLFSFQTTLNVWLKLSFLHPEFFFHFLSATCPDSEQTLCDPTKSRRISSCESYSTLFLSKLFHPKFPGRFLMFEVFPRPPLNTPGSSFLDSTPNHQMVDESLWRPWPKWIMLLRSNKNINLGPKNFFSNHFSLRFSCFSKCLHQRLIPKNCYSNSIFSFAASQSDFSSIILIFE